MPRKKKQQKKDANGNPIPSDVLALQRLENLTRENVQEWIKERNAISTKLMTIALRLDMLRQYNVPEEEIAKQRELMEPAAMERHTKLENYIRQTAMLVLRAKGVNHWLDVVNSNLDMIKTVEEKQRKTLATL